VHFLTGYGPFSAKLAQMNVKKAITTHVVQRADNKITLEIICKE